MKGWIRRKREDWAVRRALRPLSKLPPMRVTPELILLDAYWQVRNALADGKDPSAIDAERATEEGEEPVDALSWFRAGLRIQFDTGDELRAFDEFALGLNEQAQALRHSPEALARQETELRMVREHLATRAEPPDFAPPPD